MMKMCYFINKTDVKVRSQNKRSQKLISGDKQKNNTVQYILAFNFTIN